MLTLLTAIGHDSTRLGVKLAADKAAKLVR